MWKYLLILLLAAAPTFGQEPPKKLKTPNSEVEDYLVFLQKYEPKEDQQYIRGFTTYAMPEDLRPSALITCSFLLHSLSGPTKGEAISAGSFYPLAIAEYKDDEKAWDTKTVKELNKITDTLYWIDIRNYNWTPEAWESITKFDGYMLEPIVKHENNSLLRLLAGNAVVRMDWFIYNVSIATNQTDRDKKNVSLYRTLLYSNITQPKTVQDFRAAWGLPDIGKSREIGNEFATIVTKSQNVSRHNRILFGYRTELGWLYQTYDVKFDVGNRDYIERFPQFGGKPPDIFDGGEIFGTNQLKLQTYDLYDDKENLADFADATIVRHLSDVLGDARVITPHGCFDCHAVGPLPSENTIKEYLKSRGGIYYKDKADQLRVERAYLSDRFEESVKENQELYAKALKKSNGTLPEDNLKAYYRIIQWYGKPLDLPQVLTECGVTEEELNAKCKEGLQDINYKVPGRLSILLSINEPIPRTIWEDANTDGIPGLFQQTMIILNGLTKITTEVIEHVGYIKIGCNIYKEGNTVLKVVEPNTKVTSVLGTQESFTRVRLADGTEGWVETKNYESLKK